MDFSNLDSWVIPVFIYFAKITEISLMSIRIIMIARGFRISAMLIAVVESLVWISILSLIVTNLDNLLNIAAFVLGMSSGTYLGILIEKKLAMGLVLIRVITQKPAQQMLLKLREIGFRVTAINGTSNYGTVQILFAAVRRKNIDQFASIAKHFNPKAFFTIEDIREASQIIRNSNGFKSLDTLVDQKISDIPSFEKPPRSYKGGRNNEKSFRSKQRPPRRSESNYRKKTTESPAEKDEQTSSSRMKKYSANSNPNRRRRYKKPSENSSSSLKSDSQQTNQ